MSSFKFHLDSHFRNCQQLAHARDEHRNRDVTIHLIPGRFDIVGINDTVDAWVAPVAADPFSVNIKRMLDDIQAGKPIHEVVQHPPRKRKQLLPAQAELPLSLPRRRVLVNQQADQQPPAAVRRRVALQKR